MCLTSRMELTGWYCRDQELHHVTTYGVKWMCLTSRMELIRKWEWYCRDQDQEVTTPCNYTMCLTTRMELTGWYCRDQEVTKPCVLLHVWS